MSTFVEMDCGDDVRLEVTDDGEVIFHGWDEEVEAIAREMGFPPSNCARLREILAEIPQSVFDHDLDCAIMDGDEETVEEMTADPESFYIEPGDEEYDLALGEHLNAEARSGNLQMVKALMALGADWKEHRAYIAAIWGGHLELVQFFLDLGADPAEGVTYLLTYAGAHGAPSLDALGMLMKQMKSTEEEQ